MEFAATVCMTRYVTEVPSAAFTVEATGPVKLLGVVPLTCTVDPTDTLAPLVLKVATKAVTSVPHGILTVMVFAFSSITPEAAGLANEKEVIAFVSELIA